MPHEDETAEGQKRTRVASAAPITLAEMLSAISVSQPKTLRVTHRQAIGMTNDAKLTIEKFSRPPSGPVGRRCLKAELRCRRS